MGRGWGVAGEVPHHWPSTADHQQHLCLPIVPLSTADRAPGRSVTPCLCPGSAQRPAWPCISEPGQGAGLPASILLTARAFCFCLTHNIVVFPGTAPTPTGMRAPGLPPCIDSISLYFPMQMAVQSGQKFSISSPSFCKSSPALSEVKQPPPYEDAVKQVTAWFLFPTGLGLPMMSFCS